jgi:hypothetical protein
MDRAMLAQLREWCATLKLTQEYPVGGDVLRYWFRAAIDDSNTTIWLLIFYNRIVFVGMTGPKELPVA